MLRTWLVFVGLTVLWIMTRSVYLEAWTPSTSAPASLQDTSNSCPACLQFLKQNEVSPADSEIKSLAVVEATHQACIETCMDYRLREQQVKKQARSPIYEP